MIKKMTKTDNILWYIWGRYLKRYSTSIITFFLILAFSANSYSNDIHRVVSEGDLAKAKLLLQDNPILVNKEDRNGRTPIFTAIMRQNYEMVKLLIDKGALVRVGDNNLRAPIHFAGFNNDKKMIELLLQNGAVIDTRAIGAATPLIHSSLFNRYQLSQFLIEQGADINIQCNALTTPLYFAVLNNNMEYLSYLLAAGANPDTPDFLNRTPLYVAVRDGYLEIVKTLIKYGADFRFKDTYLNRTLLHLSSIRGHKEVAKLLIQEGMDVNGKDDNGYTPLGYAHRYRQGSMADFLKKKGGKANVFKNLMSKEKILKQEIKVGEAMIIKLQNGSWGIRTKKHFLIFAYSEIGNPPSEKSIVNGYLIDDEIKEVTWIYFDLSFHPPKAAFSLQGRTPIYSMQDRSGGLHFILNNAFKRNYSVLNLAHSYFPKQGQHLDVKGLKVMVVPSYRENIGYFIKCDGLAIFWLSGVSDNYISSKKDTKAIDYMIQHDLKADILLLGTPDGIGPEKGNGICESYFESQDLKPKAVFFMGKEHLERRIYNQIKRRIQDPGNILCSENPGDRFIYYQGEVRR